MRSLRVKCQKCKCCYVGQTKRLLITRRQEYKDNINYKERYHTVIPKNITEHQFNVEKHDMCWEGIEILHKERNGKKRCLVQWSILKSRIIS